MVTLLSRYSAGPLSALILLVCVVIIASIAESYTYSLRYTYTKDIMSASVSLMIISAVITPCADLAADSASVISACSSMMLVYLPVMAGILAFSGHAIASAGYYSSVVVGAGLLSKISSSVLLPLLNVILSLSVCAGITNRINLGSVIEMTSKCFKWLLTFAVSMFVAVVGMNSALAGAGETLSGKAAKFTLTSFVPMIGGSLAEAYQTLKGSLGLLRSGMGVFVIVAVTVSFAPVLIRAILWSVAVGTAKLVGEAFCVSSASRVFNALGAYLSALRAVIIGVLCAFVLSTAVIMRVGGSG